MHFFTPLLSVPTDNSVPTDHDEIKRYYGTNLSHLIRLVRHIDPASIAYTLVSANDLFIQFLKTRDIADTIIYDLLKKLRFRYNDIPPLIVSTSCFLDCYVKKSVIVNEVTFSTLRNAIITLYESWHDGKCYTKRIVDNLHEQDTYPAIFIQPHVEKLHSIITHNSVNGSLYEYGNHIHNVHSTEKTVSVQHEQLIQIVNSIFIKPKRIFYIIENEKLKIYGIEEYPITSNALINALWKKNIDDRDFFSRIFPNDLVRFHHSNYRIVNSKVKQYSNNKILNIHRMYVEGIAVFETTDFSNIPGNTDCILFTNYYYKRHIYNIASNIRDKCQAFICPPRFNRGHLIPFLRSYDLTGIVSQDILDIDQNAKVIYTHSQIIHEFDRVILCIHNEFQNKSTWCTEGTITYNNEYVAKISDGIFESLYTRLCDYMQSTGFPLLSIDEQKHLASLRQIMEKIRLIKR